MIELSLDRKYSNPRLILYPFLFLSKSLSSIRKLFTDSFSKVERFVKNFPGLELFLYPRFVKKFIFFVLKFIFEAIRYCVGSPIVVFREPFRPVATPFLRIIFKIPAVPSASYLADGDVTTSTLSIASAGN